MARPDLDEGPTTLPAMLAARAASAPEEPWLFYHLGWDWHWLSWSQSAHQVAAGARELRRSGTAGRDLVAFAARFEPDAIASALAILAAGAVAVHDDSETGAVDVPPAPSRLDRWTPDLEALGGDRRPDDLVFGARTGTDLRAAVDRWRRTLPPLSPKPGGRPVVLASASVGRATWEVLVAWTLRTGAAWVLEDDPDAFVSALLRNRPTLIVAPGSDAGLAALALEDKSHRRWHRLLAVGLTDDAPAEIVHREAWDDLGARVVAL